MIAVCMLIAVFALVATVAWAVAENEIQDDRKKLDSTETDDADVDP